MTYLFFSRDFTPLRFPMTENGSILTELAKTVVYYENTFLSQKWEKLKYLFFSRDLTLLRFPMAENGSILTELALLLFRVF